MNMHPKLSLVLPCYQEESHLEASVERIVQIFSLLSFPYEIILVDDCSLDGTRGLIHKILSKYPALPIQAVFHSQNRGRGAAFLSGFEKSTGSIVGFFDVDLEVSPTYLLECVQKLLYENADLVVGERHYVANSNNVIRLFLSVVYRQIVRRILRLPARLDAESGYKFFRRSALQEYEGKFENEGWFWDTEVVSRFVIDSKKVLSVPCLFIRNGNKASTVQPVQASIEHLRELASFKRTLS